MAFNLMSQAESKINSTMGSLKNELPGGKIPEAAALAELKGTVPNIQSLKNVFASDTKVPENLLAEFKEEDLLTTIGIPKPELKIPKISLETTPISLDMFDKTEPKIEAPIDTEGLTDEQIAEEERKKEIRQKRNDKAAEIMNGLKSKAKGAIDGIAGKVEGAIQGGVEGAINNATAAVTTNIINNALGGLGGGCGPNLAARIAAFAYFKAQFGTIKGRADGIKGTIDGLKEKGKDVMKGGTETISIKGVLEGVDKTLKNTASSLKAKTDSMKPTGDLGGDAPEPDNKANSEVSQKTREARDKAEGFAKNLKQTIDNVGKVIKGVFDSLKNLLGTVIKAIGAIMQIVSFIAFLKQMAELLMMIFVKNDACANRGGNQSNSANSADQFLGDIGYPGFTGEDFSTSINEAINNLNTPVSSPLSNPSPNTSFPNISSKDPLTFPGGGIPGTGTGKTNPSSLTDPQTGLPFDASTTGAGNTLGNFDLFNPIMFGPTQLGIPLIQEDLNPSLSGKTFDNHPILGDLTDIHPQLINELYEDGVLPLVDPNNPKALEPDQYAEDLDKLYDEIENELNETKQIEYIERLYNLNFEMIGYRRYKA